MNESARRGNFSPGCCGSSKELKMKSKRTLLHFVLVPMSVFFAGAGISFAVDETKPGAEVDHDVTKNPITGNTTKTTTVESEKNFGEAGVKKSKKVKRQKFNREGEKIEDTRKSKVDVDSDARE
jgi:hypothetical protein